MEMISQNSRNKVVSLNYQMQGGHIIVMGSNVEEQSTGISVRWPIRHGLPEGKTGGKPTKLLCNIYIHIYNHKISTTDKQKTKDS